MHWNYENSSCRLFLGSKYYSQKDLFIVPNIFTRLMNFSWPLSCLNFLNNSNCINPSNFDPKFSHLKLNRLKLYTDDTFKLLNNDFVGLCFGFAGAKHSFYVFHIANENHRMVTPTFAFFEKQMQ